MYIPNNRIIEINGQGIIPINALLRASTIELLGYYALFSNTDICWYTELNLVLEISGRSEDEVLRVRGELEKLGLIFKPYVEPSDEEQAIRSEEIRMQIANLEP